MPSKHRNHNGLTDEEQVIADVYLCDPAKNKTAAYLTVFEGRCKRTTAHAKAYEFFKRPHVRAYVEEELAAEKEQHQISNQRIEQAMAEIAFFDPSMLFDDEGRTLPVRDMDEATRRVISSIDEEPIFLGRGEGRALVEKKLKVKTHSKTEMLTSLARIRGMFKDSMEVKGDVLDKLLSRAAETPVGPPSVRGRTSGSDLETE